MWVCSSRREGRSGTKDGYEIWELGSMRRGMSRTIVGKRHRTTKSKQKAAQGRRGERRWRRVDGCDEFLGDSGSVRERGIPANWRRAQRRVQPSAQRAQHPRVAGRSRAEPEPEPTLKPALCARWL